MHPRPFESQPWENQSHDLQHLTVCYALGTVLFWWRFGGDSWLIHLLGDSLLGTDLYHASSYASSDQKEICNVCPIGETVLSLILPGPTYQVSFF